MSTNVLYANSSLVSTEAPSQQDNHQRVLTESAGTATCLGSWSVGHPTTLAGLLDCVSRMVERIMREERTSVGTAQMVMGVTAFMFGIVSAINAYNPSSLSGILFWGSLIHISAGAVIININKVPGHRGASVLRMMNIISCVIAGISIVLFCVDFTYNQYWSRDQVKVHGISGVMMVLSIGQLAISASILAFTPQVVSSNISQVEKDMAAVPCLPPKYDEVAINTSQTRCFPTTVDSSVSTREGNLPSTV